MTKPVTNEGIVHPAKDIVELNVAEVSLLDFSVDVLNETLHFSTFRVKHFNIPRLKANVLGKCTVFSFSKYAATPEVCEIRVRKEVSEGIEKV